ncbi:MAG: ABC transporter ATP-binding protein [Armatimonadetes bacterium]|nr:ABC transporter ATP-binding protein [Armatimonadota bacterium]
MIAIKNLTVRLSGREVIKNINLEIAKGKTLVVMGLSGVGKSTLLRCIIGLMKPAEGAIYIGGKEITRLSYSDLDKVRKKIGMVFQSPALFDSLTIGENVAFGLREHTNFPEEEIQRIVAEKLAIVDLEGKENLMPSQLSGGMQKRASLARTIATNPEGILYDEPTSGLDPIMSNVINQLINNLKEQFGVTSIVVTHDLESAFMVGDEIAMLYQGEIVGKGSPQEFKRSTSPIVQQFIQGSIQGPIKV